MENERITNIVELKYTPILFVEAHPISISKDGCSVANKSGVERDHINYLLDFFTDVCLSVKSAIFIDDMQVAI
jgi:hypothetical protein